MKNQDFEDFMTGEGATPPQHVADKVFARIHRDLNPSKISVFRKLLFIQIITGFVTLLFCPQMGVGLTSSMGLMGVLMKFGEPVCMAGCGALFLGLSALAASFFLTRDEVRVLRKNQVVQFPILGAAALSIFICFGAPVLTVLGAMWFAGAIVGAGVSLQLGFFLRRKIA